MENLKEANDADDVSKIVDVYANLDKLAKTTMCLYKDQIYNGFVEDKYAHYNASIYPWTVGVRVKYGYE